MTRKDYKLARDGSGWGVLWEGALINQEPMTKAEAQKLEDECNSTPTTRRFADENPRWEEEF